MNAQKLVLIAAALAFLGGCATEPEKPAPQPSAAPPPAPPPPPPPLVKPAPPPAPIAKVEPKPEAKPEPKPQPKKPAVVNLASTELFEFNKAVLNAQARQKLDTEVIAKLRDVRYIIVQGHADRLGSNEYNQRLSQRRADATRAYLVAKGMDPSKIEALGFGETLPVKSCPDQNDRQALIECLGPNRRVVVEVQGTPR
jgi:OOP family OmpA-OmpF porin